MQLPFLAVGVQDLVEIVPWTIIAQLCNLLIQVYLFKRFLFEPVKKVIQKRKDEVGEIYAEAQAADEEAKSSKASYEKLMAGAKSEAVRIMKEATQDANARSEALIAEAKQEASALREKASRDIDRERRKAVNDAKDEISNIAMDVAEKVVERQLDEKDQKALIAAFIERMGEAE